MNENTDSARFTCAKCEAPQPRSAFYERNPLASNPNTSACRRCRREDYFRKRGLTETCKICKDLFRGNSAGACGLCLNKHGMFWCYGCGTVGFKTGKNANVDMVRRCEECPGERQRLAEQASAAAFKKWAPQDKAWARRLYQQYGITHEDYSQMLESQNGACKICKKRPQKRRLFIDHNHKTGRIRGLLCGSCNFGIGHLRDDPEILKSALDYLAVDINTSTTGTASSD
jgi:hypothetical protein